MNGESGISAGREDQAQERLRTGWIMVAAQGLLIVALIFLPRRGSLSLPLDAFDVVGILAMTLGLAVVLIALITLGRALTANPVPVEGAGLRTSGIYSVVRHPFYAGILLAGLGFTLAIGSWWQVVCWLALLVFFVAKATWEDRMLAEKYGVTWFDYADHVGGFLPRFRRE